ncbi:uncharacterized protein LOC124418234 [Gallus gallus]|uniref:uncharacterized protein LOC124418234 n=1 Tax=Gallus gallus TaxID=9031 RepID=UPI001F029ED2|nr:uncharacterized protein LOC124418234 [Gallus gallus]
MAAGRAGLSAAHPRCGCTRGLSSPLLAASIPQGIFCMLLLLRGLQRKAGCSWVCCMGVCCIPSSQASLRPPLLPPVSQLHVAALHLCPPRLQSVALLSMQPCTGRTFRVWNQGGKLCRGAGAAAPMAPGTGRCYGDTKSCRAAKSTDLRNRSPPPHLPMLFFGFGLFFFRCRRSPDRFISSVRDLKRSPVSGRRTSCEEGEEKAARDAPMDPELFLRPSAAPSRTPPWAVGGARPPGTLLLCVQGSAQAADRPPEAAAGSSHLGRPHFNLPVSRQQWHYITQISAGLRGRLRRNRRVLTRVRA